jgi:hypothetical protein
MTEHSNKTLSKDERGSTALAVVALLVAIAALFLAWMAYDRAGRDLGPQIREQVNQAIQETERAVPEVDVETNNDGNTEQTDDGTQENQTETDTNQ